jgi:hypothetical protein
MGQHKWSGWPGAHCILCGAGDALEYALADGWYNPCNDSWDTEEHKLEVIQAQNNCPYTKEGQDPYTVELVDGKPTIVDSVMTRYMEDSDFSLEIKLDYISKKDKGIIFGNKMEERIKRWRKEFLKK